MKRAYFAMCVISKSANSFNSHLSQDVALEKIVACVRQISQDFRTMAEQEKSLDVERIAFHLQLTGPDMRRCVWKGILSPEGFQWHKEAMARQKVLGERLIKDTAALVQALIEWAVGLGEKGGGGACAIGHSCNGS